MAEEAAQPPFLVVIGSSAGGIEALSILCSTLSPDFPAPIVVAQHLDPQRPSNLANVLDRRSKIQIQQVDGPTDLRAGCVYVVPSNRHVTIQDGNVALASDHQDRPRPSIDLLLSTAAEQYGDRLIAVILTGAGRDGASGALEVKNHGGTVIIQNPATARFPSMPLALPPTAVDHIVDIEQLGPLLEALVRGLTLPEEPKTVDGLREILALVSGQSGVDFGTYKQTTILRRIARRMVATQQVTLEDYRKRLDVDREEVKNLARGFLIKVTEFFRDEEAFDFLRASVLPVLIERARSRGRALRIWSAGCATGEEPYSIAILHADMLGPELGEWNITIFATDLDEESIRFARRGLYPDKVVAKLPESYRERFFEQTESGPQVAKSIRQMVIYGQQDLGRGVPFPRMDLVVCRNLLIYFKPELQQLVLDRFAFSLGHTDGFLFLGKAETARPSNDSFELVEKRWKVYRSKPSGARLMRQMRAPLQLAPEVLHLAERPSSDPAGLGEDDLVHMRRFSEQLLRLVPIGVAIVDRGYHLVNINQVARRLLSVRDVQRVDFLHAVRGIPYQAVRDAIDTAFRERGSVTLPEVEIDPTSGGPRHVTMTFAHAPQDAGGHDVVIISILDASETVRARTILLEVQAEQARLVEKLTAANKRLTELNKDLQDANEELQATNEEMSLAQEELQASNEELEATNEELQATNEELETNNEELQATNEELEATNDELGARTQELQDIARTLSSERLRLNEIVETAPIYILMVRGAGLLVEVVNPSCTKLLATRDWLGRPIYEALRGTDLAQVSDSIRRAFWDDHVTEIERVAVTEPLGGADPSSKHVLDVILVPTHDAEGKVEGVVMFGKDVPPGPAAETSAQPA
jgi:two-component system CheB/CheR fusion protein